MVYTPKYDETVNTERRTSTITIATDGSAVLHSIAEYTGISQNFPAHLEEYPDETRKQLLYESLDINNFEIIDLRISRNKERIPGASMEMSLALPKLASVSGKRMFIPAGLLSGKISIPPDDTIRHSPVQADARGRMEENNIVFSLPEGYRLESIFEPVHIQGEFGSFDMTISQEQEKIVLHRKLVLNSTIQPKEKFTTLLIFLKTIAKADKTKIVAVK